jgi:hypothetical protein
MEGGGKLTWEVWAALSTIGAFVIAALSLGIANRQSVIASAKTSGATGERMAGMRDELTKLVATVTGHTAQIAEHDGSFKAIDVKLDFIMAAIEKMSAKLDRHCEEP